MERYEELQEAVKEEEISEAKRLLYVAITELKKKCICGLTDLSRTARQLVELDAGDTS